MNFKNLKIGQKIISGFLLVAFIALVIGITGIIGMNSMGNSFEKVANEDMTSIYHLGEMNIAVERIFEDYLQLTDPKLDNAKREQFFAKINSDRQKLAVAMSEYEKIEQSAEEARMYGEVTKLIEPWRNVNKQIDRMNERFVDLDLANPARLVANIEMFMKDHYELQLKVRNSIQDGYTFEGGGDAQACNFGIWMKEFSTRNATFNASLRDMRQHHDHFHDAVRQIKNYINQGNTDAARTYYIEAMQPSAKEVFSIFDLILNEAAQAQSVLNDMNEAVTVESAELHGIFGEKFDQLKNINRQEAREERANGANTFRFSNILIILTIVIGISIAVVMGIVITRNITGGLNNGLAFAEKIAKGDLTVDLDSEVLGQRDEVGQLGRALQHMVEQLKGIIGDVVTSADNITAASQEMSTGSMQLSQGASEQASSAEEISSSMEQMAANIQQNTDNAMQTEKIAIGAADGIRRVSDNAVASTKAMKDIASKVSIIGDIAYKTNILALNAAVEAARAGEHGHGFAVVADEVRKLAERSQVAADEIDELSVNSVNMADEAGKQLMEIAPEIENTARLVQEIAAASMEQNSGAEQINSAIQELNKVIQQNAAASEEMASSSEELSSQSDQMKEVISYFAVEDGYRRAIQNKAKKATTANTPSSKPETKQTKTSNSGIDLNLDDMDSKIDEFEQF